MPILDTGRVRKITSSYSVKMVKKLVYHWQPWWRYLQKNNYLVVKLGISVLSVVLAFRLLYGDRSSDVSPVSTVPFIDSTQISTSPVVSVKSQGTSDQNTIQEYGTESLDSEGKCDLFIGDWVPFEGEPLYTNSSCRLIEDHQNCMKNGRPDKGYLYWRWKPRGCELARVDPKKFLDLMRNKSWAFIGDSISRNHVQSFLCVLSTVEMASEVYHDENYKSRRWVFPSHNLTVSVLWSPLLAKAAIFEDINGVSTSEIELHIDALDESWTQQLPTFDYTIFSGGKWFTKDTVYYQNNLVLGCYHCPKRNLTGLGLDFAYRKVLRNVFDHIIGSNHKGEVFYRTSTPNHFEGGEWFSGGTCKRLSPAKEGEVELKEEYRILREVEMEEFGRAEVMAKESGVSFGLLDVGPLSLLRPDGHPGPYRFFQPFAGGVDGKVINDCLHWCLPGPIDTWNDVLMEMVVNG